MLMNLRNAMVGGEKLPYLCELEYLESTGTQYINTGVIGGDGTLGEIKVKRTSSAVNECIFGAWNTQANRLWFAYSNTSKWYPGYGNTAGSSNISSTGNDFVVIRSKVDNGRFGYDIDSQSFILQNTYSVGFSCSNPILIFAMGTDSGANYFAKARVSYAKIYSNNALVRDFIPVLTYDFVPCMYDRVTRQFYRNAGTGEFVAGPDKPIPDNSFIRITPTTTSIHYPPLNTGVTYDSTDAMKIEVEWRIVPNSAIGTWGVLFGNAQPNNYNGFLLRHYNSNESAVGQAPLSTSTSNTGGSTLYITGDTSWSKMVFDSSAPTGKVITRDGETCTYNNQFFDASRWTRTTNEFFIGEGARGYGATIATDWRRIKFWKNGTLIRDYVPHRSNGFIDLVSGNILAKASNSNTLVEYMEE